MSKSDDRKGQADKERDSPARERHLPDLRPEKGEVEQKTGTNKGRGSDRTDEKRET